MMKIEVQGVRVVRGEFQILQGDSGLAPPGDERTQLVIGCQYGIIDKKGVVLALGTASNSPTASTTSIRLSDSTLEAFQKFFTYLEHDIVNALEGASDAATAERNDLEAILAGGSPRRS